MLQISMRHPCDCEQIALRESSATVRAAPICAVATRSVLVINGEFYFTLTLYNTSSGVSDPDPDSEDVSIGGGVGVLDLGSEDS